MSPPSRFPKAVLLAFLATVGVAACETFDAPPYPSLAGLTDGLLADAGAPLVIDFTKPVVESSLSLLVVPYVVDDQGNLPGEGNNTSDLDTGLLYSHGDAGDEGGRGVFAPDDTSFTIFPTAPLPIGPSLVVLVNAGLSNHQGVTLNARRRLPFGFETNLVCPEPSKLFHSGDYFFLAQVTTPIATQVKLFASIRVDATSGAFTGQFTDAIRNRAQGRCPMKCPDTDVCQLLPSPMCAIPSEPAGSVDDFSDFVPNAHLPTGFSFTATGCVTDREDGSVVFTTAPANVAVSQPAVTLYNARLNGLFTAKAGVLHATGAFSAQDVLLGTFSSGAASGDLTARSLSAAEAPAGIPAPP